MKHARWFNSVIAILLGSLFASLGHADTVKSEDFTGTTSTNNWYFFNGACLTAGSSTSASPGPIPGCTAISYYNENLVGGKNGVSGSTQTLPDPAGSGALRLTNGNPGGYHQNGAIVSTVPYPTDQGIQITFKTVTYRGDSGGAGHDGADGISFYLMDASYPAGIGSWGGSLGYSCSNSNAPYDGLAGAYLGLGIDEYGNFLNGTSLMSGYTGSNSATGDNTALGYGYKPGRIGIRGAGSVSWSALTAAYGTDLGSSYPYYPASLAHTCPSGFSYDSVSGTCLGSCTTSSGNYSSSQNMCAACVSGYTYSQGADTCGKCSNSAYTYDSSNNSCWQCSSGTYDSSSHKCTGICAAGNYDPGSNQCIDICSAGVYNSPTNKCIQICPSSGNWAYSSSLGKCEQCASGYAWDETSKKCKKGGSTQSATASQNSTSATPTTATPSSVSPATISVSTKTPTYSALDVSPTSYTQAAVKNTCKTGHLWNYTNATSPVDVGAATLTNGVNTKRILDYAPIPNAYTELSSLATPLTIASESAMKRGDATPIFYALKITQDGLLSLSYSVNGGSYQSVIKNQSITTSNGPIPANVYFGIAGSTGGSTNIHEIMCFKAQPDTQSGSSTSVNEKLSSKVQTGTQAYFAYYDPNNWIGAVSANDLIDTAGVVTVSSTANWDASCVLTGTGGKTCTRTGASGPASAQSPTSRVILTCGGNCSGSTGNTGIAFEYASLTLSLQNSMNAGDSQGLNRVAYLRGDRSNEITSVGTGLFRIRDNVLSDIVDSSPVWVGPPSNSYTSSWGDRLPANPSYTPDPMPENSASQSYLQYVAAKQTRQNVVYAGANDGLLHGFRSGSMDANNKFVSTNNDGQEVLAYIPNAIVKAIHSTTDPTVDFSSTQYGHRFFVDATPGADDLFYAGAWHTWLVGGLGAGGSSIYALDVTDPSSFSESNAASIVVGEWKASTISCSTPGGSTCGTNLGNTYGTPQIRRLHNGKWAVLFGNGFGSSTGDAGVFIMTVDPTDGSKVFYYLSTGTSAAGNNGIAYVTPVDLDGDHIADYIYAGDLQGNVWRFDITSTDPSNWTGTGNPVLVFSTPSGQPITTKVVALSTLVPGASQSQVMLEFGTGRKTLVTNTSPDSYTSGTQSLYGVWDWNFGSWNSQSSVKYRSLDSTSTGLSAPYTVAKSNLQQQTLTVSTTSSVAALDGSSNAVCWKGLTQCSSPSTNSSFGWYLDLPTASGLTGISEQIIYNPIILKGAFIVNSTVPPNNVPTSCAVVQETGYTYVLSATTGGLNSGTAGAAAGSGSGPSLGPVGGPIPSSGDSSAVAVQTNGTGTAFSVSTSEGTNYLISNSVSGHPFTLQYNGYDKASVNRMTWVELR